MIEKGIVSKVHQLKMLNQAIFFNLDVDGSTRENIYLIFNSNQNQLIYSGSVWYFIPLTENKLVFQNINGGPLQIIDFDGNASEISNKECFINTLDLFYNDNLNNEIRVIIGSAENRTFCLLNGMLELTLLKIDYSFINDKYLVARNENYIITYDRNEIEMWRLDLKDLKRSRLHGNNAYLLVERKNGHITIIKLEDGSIIWENSNYQNSFFKVHRNDVIINTGREMVIHDITNGSIKTKIRYKEIEAFSETSAITGDFKVQDDVILCKDQRKGIVYILDRNSLELIDKAVVDKNLPNKTQMIWLNDKLYVVDMDFTLHIFEKE